MTTIKNIIFDLGAVILNIDPNKTIEALTLLGITPQLNETGHHYSNDLFYRFEMGMIEAEAFKVEFAKLSDKEVSTEALTMAWNQMILDFPKERIDYLKELKKDYRLFLLSNTNRIHHEYFSALYQKYFQEDFECLFEKCYFSHHLGMRKPMEEIYTHVLIDQSIKAEETLFIDDSLENINAASKLQIQTLHLQHSNLFIEHLKKNL